MIRVKICGITTPAALDAAVEGGADWIGFNFFPASPRFVSPALAASLSARHADGPGRVALFVEPTDGDVGRVLDHLPATALQVYVSAQRAAALRDRFGLPVWRALPVATREDLPTGEEPVDAYLVEPKPPAGATRPGGNATRLDWTLTAGWRAPKPWLLAGGLTPDNVAAAIAASEAGAVDVSSGVERARGEKDPALIRAFIARAKAGSAGSAAA